MNRTPPLLVAAALLFWGWQTGLLVFAVVLALAVELPRWATARWEISDPEFRRLRDLCAILVIGSLIYRMMTRETGNELMSFFQALNFTARNRSMQEVMNSAFVFVQWWPLLFAPLMAAQVWSTARTTPFHIYSYIFGRRPQEGKPLAAGRVNIAWPYFVLTLIAASAVNTRSVWFYPVMCGLIGWALWSIQPRRTPAWLWASLFMLISLGGYWGHVSIRGLQSRLDNVFTQWLNNLTRREPGHLEARTAMGQVGRMKLSGRIVMWAEAPGPPPALLRDASYDRLAGTSWSASLRGYEDVVAAGAEATTWPLIPDQPAPHRVTLSMPFSKREGWISVPNGTTVLKNLPVGQVRTNAFGFIQLKETPGLIQFTAEYGAGPTHDHPPFRGRQKDEPNDLGVPPPEREAIQQIVHELGLRRGQLDQRVRIIADYFTRNYSYTTWLKAKDHLPRPGETPLGRFLTTAKTGHCEYFATATVLLLREAGIPARYANGYSVQEKKGDQYLIRERHAHAWALYWDERDQAWHDLDTTPGGWAEVEERENASIFEPLGDLWANLWHDFSVWRWTGEKGAMRKYVFAGIGLLIGVLVWRLLRGSKRAKAKPRTVETALDHALRLGIDSAFYEIERKLTGLGLERHPGEALANWLVRIQPLTPLPVARLRPLLALHYRYRFDPRGLTPRELATLAGEAQNWLATANEAESSVTTG